MSNFEKGMKIRRDVLGDAYVDRAMQNADEFARPLQELVTNYCWGDVWAREGLERKTRSLLNVALLATLNRPHELRVHIKGALRNGCGRDEIREVLLHTAVYAGIPAGVDGFRIAREALAEYDAERTAEGQPS